MEMDDLLAEIRAAFPEVPMPSERELRFHRDDCALCEYLSDYLDERRNEPVGAATIRYMCQEMSCLSAEGWVWALPHYLPFCLTKEAEEDGMETEFLIDSLGPSDEFKDETKAHLSRLSALQIRCVIHFFEWLLEHPRWKRHCGDDIANALHFVNELLV